METQGSTLVCETELRPTGRGRATCWKKTEGQTLQTEGTERADVLWWVVAWRGGRIKRQDTRPKSNEGASLMAQTVKNPTGMWQTQVRSLGQEDPLEEGMATHSSLLAWRTPWGEEPGELHSPWGRKELDMTERLTTHTRAMRHH